MDIRESENVPKQAEAPEGPREEDKLKSARRKLVISFCFCLWIVTIIIHVISVLTH